MSAISFTIPGLIKKVLDKLPISTSDLARANVCTEQRLSVLDDVSSHMGASGSYLKVVTLTGSGTWHKPADMLGSVVYVTGCGAGGRGSVWGKAATLSGASAGACAIMVPLHVGSSVNYSVAQEQPLSASDGSQAPATTFGALRLAGGRAAIHGGATKPNAGGGNDVVELHSLFPDAIPLEYLIQPPAVGVVWTGGRAGMYIPGTTAPPGSGTGTPTQVLAPFQNTSLTAVGRVAQNLSADSLLGVSRQGGVRWGSGGVARRSHPQEDPASAASGPGYLRVYYPAAG